jgi:hypothetical protein
LEEARFNVEHSEKGRKRVWYVNLGTVWLATRFSPFILCGIQHEKVPYAISLEWLQSWNKSGPSTFADFQHYKRLSISDGFDCGNIEDEPPCTSDQAPPYADEEGSQLSCPLTSLSWAQSYRKGKKPDSTLMLCLHQVQFKFIAFNQQRQDIVIIRLLYPITRVSESYVLLIDTYLIGNDAY